MARTGSAVQDLQQQLTAIQVQRQAPLSSPQPKPPSVFEQPTGADPHQAPLSTPQQALSAKHGKVLHASHTPEPAAGTLDPRVSLMSPVYHLGNGSAVMTSAASTDRRDSHSHHESSRNRGLPDMPDEASGPSRVLQTAGVGSSQVKHLTDAHGASVMASNDTALRHAHPMHPQLQAMHRPEAPVSRGCFWRQVCPGIEVRGSGKEHSALLTASPTEVVTPAVASSDMPQSRNACKPCCSATSKPAAQVQPNVAAQAPLLFRCGSYPSLQRQAKSQALLGSEVTGNSHLRSLPISITEQLVIADTTHLPKL